MRSIKGGSRGLRPLYTIALRNVQNDKSNATYVGGTFGHSLRDRAHHEQLQSAKTRFAYLAQCPS